MEPFGAFVNPRAVGVDQVSGDVYVVDAGAGSVLRFDGDGLESPFSAVQPYVAGNAWTGTPSSAFAFESLFPPEVAVDPGSGGFGSGLVYVTNVAAENVAVYSNDGAFVGEIPSGGASPVTGGEVCGVALGATGDVYVSHFTGHVDRYHPVDGLPDHDVFVSQFATPFLSCGLAVDSAGSVYVQQWSFAGTGAVLKYPGALKVDPAGSGVAVNPADDHLFVDQSTQVAQYDALGTTGGLPKLGTGLLTGSTGVGVSASTGRVYAADSNGVVQVFETAVPGVPVLSGESALKVTSVSAEIQADINPQLAATNYAVQYGTDTTYASGSAPSAAGVDVGEGEVSKHIRVALGALAPGTLYHYRAVAKNRFGTTTGLDHTFKTFTGGSFSPPDNRAWELISPLDKNGGEIRGIVDPVNIGGVVQATPDGDTLTYTSVTSFGSPEGAQTRDQYIAKREPGEWASENITAPSVAGTYSDVGAGGPYKIFSEDLSHAAMLNGDFPPIANPPLPGSGAPDDYKNVYLRDNLTGGFRAVMTSAPHTIGEELLDPSDATMEVVGASPDLTHVVISTPAALTSGAILGSSRPNLYEWTAGELAAINILPGVMNGETTPGIVDLGARVEGAAMSDNGLRVFWTLGLGTPEQRLFVRERIGTVEAETVEIDISHGSGASGRGEYRAASADGSKAFFTGRRRLTEDSTAGGFKNSEDLYEFNVDTGVLTDLTPDSNAEDIGGASVQGVLGASGDGSYVYFVAGGALPQAHANHAGEHPVTGGSNLYVSHDGDLSFVATLSGSEVEELTWKPALSFRTARVTRDGLHAVFNSRAALTEYDSRGVQQVYEYDAVSGVLLCASCNPSGAVPAGASTIPAGTPNGNDKALYLSRVVSDDGSRVFFDSRDALVPQDTNGHQDVYEYEDGMPHLVSGGTSDSDAEFVDASADGSDVFFITGQRLVGQDEDELVDLYDARVNGGIPLPPAVIPCSGAGCQGVPPPPPIFATPSTITFTGLGNYKPPHKVATRKAGKKVVRHRQGKHRKARHKRVRSARSTRSVEGRVRLF